MSERKLKFQSRISANWDKVPIVEGRVTERGTETIDDKARPWINVLTAEGDVRVYQSAGLEEAFKVTAVGDMVRIEFLALLTTKKGQSFRQFRTQVWTDEETAQFATTARKPRTTK